MLKIVKQKKEVKSLKIESLLDKLKKLKLIGVHLELIDRKEIRNKKEYSKKVEAPIRTVSIDKNVKRLIIPDGTDYIEGRREDSDTDEESLKAFEVEEVVVLPESLRIIEKECFANNVIGSIELPSKLEYIGYQAFRECAGFKTIKFPETLKFIGDGAFAQTDITGKIVLPSNLKTLGNEAFAICERLEEVDFNRCEIERLNTGLFEYCTELESVKNISDNTLYIEDYAFYNCLSLKNIEIPRRLARIGNLVFYGSGVTDVDMSSDGIQLKELKNNEFTFCGNLETVRFPESFESIALSTFDNCPNLKLIDFSKSRSLKGGEELSNLLSVYDMVEIKLPEHIKIH